jgi:hypothetical protein
MWQECSHKMFVISKTRHSPCSEPYKNVIIELKYSDLDGREDREKIET